MRLTFENYEDVNVNGVTISSQRGLEGTKREGLMEVIEVIGRKDGIYKGEQGRWSKGILYNPDRFTYKEAMLHWQILNLRKFKIITN